MTGSNFVPRYFLDVDLIPTDDNSPQHILSSEDTKSQYLDFIISLESNNQVTYTENQLSVELKLIIDMFRSIGCYKVVKIDNTIIVKEYTAFSINFLKSFYEFMNSGISVVQNWRSRISLDNEISGKQVLIYFENKRIEESKLHGMTPTVFCNVPATAAIIKGRSKNNQDIYLFEINKDWHKLNFIGGKQEKIDNENYDKTILREINEELGIEKRFIRLVRLSNPIVSYGLSGNGGCLSRYPAVLYHAIFQKIYGQASVSLRWVTEEEFKNEKTWDGIEFMVTPYYRDFIFNRLEGGLKGLPYSFPDPIDIQVGKRKMQIKKWILENKDLVAAILTIIGALIGLIVFLLT